jgi:hypothetical protein
MCFLKAYSFYTRPDIISSGKRDAEKEKPPGSQTSIRKAAVLFDFW